MHVKDLIVTGDARILGKLYTDAELGGGSGSGGGEASGNYTLSKSGSTISLLRDGSVVSSVQDSDTISSYSHPVYGALTGLPSGKLTPGHNDYIEVSQVKTDNLGHVIALTTQQIKLPGGYDHPGTHPASMITGLATVATSGSYNDLSNKPTIPTKVSQLTNDSGFKTTDNNTTYTFATGDSNGQFKVTPSGGSAQNVSIKGLGSAAYTASTAYAPSSHTHNYAGSSSAGGAANSATALTGGAYVMVSSSEPTNSNCMIWVKTS